MYGLAKVHKDGVPVRPVLSMPGSAYHQIGEYVAGCLEKVPECKINASSKLISDKIGSTILSKDKELVSFDVVSLYTNVPLQEAIEYCTTLLYEQPEELRPIMDRETFKILCSVNVLMSTQDRYYFQTDGLAMGSPPAPHFANGWLSQFENTIRENSDIYFRYMDDILQELSKNECEKKLDELNSLHPKLKFTIEREKEGELAVLDMKIFHDHKIGALSSAWYKKLTDSGLIINYHALLSKQYKRSLV